MLNLASLSKAVTSVVGKRFPLSITRHYVSKWTAVEAIRELIQNALDSESPFAYSFVELDDGQALVLNSEFASLSAQTLLLGATSKAGSDESIGSFGEGYKLALLVLTREGFQVDVLNGDLIWRPEFVMSQLFNDEILSINQITSPDRSNKGLTFVVHNIGDIKDSIIESCLKMQQDIGERKSTPYGDILLDRPGKLYVGSLYICDTDMQYSYDVKPSTIRLERDRQTVSTWDLKWLVKDMWLSTKEYDRIAHMISEEVPDVEHLQYSSDALLSNACYEVFKENYPGSLIAESPTHLKEMVKQGMTKYVYVNSIMYSQVSKNSHYKEDTECLRVVKKTPHAQLSAWLSANRSEMRTKAIMSFKELLDAAKDWK